MGIIRQRGIWECRGEEWLAELRGLSDVNGASGRQGWASAHQLTMSCPALLAPEITAGGAQGAEPCRGGIRELPYVLEMGLSPGKLITECKSFSFEYRLHCLRTCKELGRQNSIISSILRDVKTVSGTENSSENSEWDLKTNSK